MNESNDEYNNKDQLMSRISLKINNINQINNDLIYNITNEKENDKGEDFFNDVLGEAQKQNIRRKRRKNKKDKESPSRLKKNEENEENNNEKEYNLENFSPDFETPLNGNNIDSIVDENIKEHNEIPDNNNNKNKRKLFKKPKKNEENKMKGYQEGFINQINNDKKILSNTLDMLEKAKELKEQDEKFKKPEKEEQSFWSKLFAPFKCE